MHKVASPPRPLSRYRAAGDVLGPRPLHEMLTDGGTVDPPSRCALWASSRHSGRSVALLLPKLRPSRKSHLAQRGRCGMD
jgi:hypothetical protein